MCLTWPSSLRLVLMIGWMSLQAWTSAVGQSCLHQANSPDDCAAMCDSFVHNHTQNRTGGFYLPSLQTLLIHPLSRAGDRLEAAWTKYPQANVSCACDTRIESPSYAIEDEGLEVDSRLASELNVPVKIAPPKIPKSIREQKSAESQEKSLESLALARNESSIQLASGVRMTGVSQTVLATGMDSKGIGEIKNKYMQRQRVGGEVSNKTKIAP